MSTILKSIMVMMTMLVISSVNAKAGNDVKYTVNADKSIVKWKGEKVTGEHYGKVNIKSGTLETKGGALSSGKIVMDMTSITNEDLEDASYNAKLVGHLKSDDFFGVEKHPTATLVIKNVVSKGGNQYEVTGDITIKGTTEEIKFPATITTSNGELKGEAKIVIDRSKFNVRYGSKSFFDDLGDKVIYDEFTLNVSLVAKN